MDVGEVLYRVLLCVYGTVVYGLIASTMMRYPHITCRAQ